MEGYLRLFLTIFDGFCAPLWEASWERLCGEFRCCRSARFSIHRGPNSGAKTTLETATTAALSQECLLPTPIVLLTELHYTTPNFQAMGT